MQNYSTLLNLTKEVEATTNVITTGNNWVQQNYSILYNEPTLSVNQEGYEYDVSDYLPNNNDTYEVLLKVSAEKGNMHFDTDAIQDFFGFYSQTANSTNGIAVIGPKRTLTVRVYSECTSVYITLCGYKKVSSSVAGIGTSMLANNDLINLSSNGKKVASNLSMPANTYTELSLGTSGSKYTAPSDGWIYLSKAVTAYSDWIKFFILTPEEQLIYCMLNQPRNVIDFTTLCVPMQKGQKAQIFYEGKGEVYEFRFIPTQGSV